MMPRLTKKNLCIACLIVGVILLAISVFVRQRNFNYKIKMDQATTNLKEILGTKILKDLVLPHQSTILLEPDHSKTGCEDRGTQILAMIIVMSSPTNKERRDVLRSIMGNFFDVQVPGHSRVTNEECDGEIGRMTMIFFTGVTMDGVISPEIEEESRLHGDMIVDNVLDTYYNLTIKSMRMYKYFEATCPLARYLVRLDDDVYLNIENLRKFLTKKCAVHDTTLMAGYKVVGVENEDDPFHKHFIPRYLWPEDKYPDFIYGFLYAMGRDAVHKIYEEALTSTIFHIDDLFLSGIVGKWKLKLELEFMPSFVTWYFIDSLTLSSCDFAKFVGGHSLSAEERVCLHNLFNSPNFVCTPLPMLFYC